MSKNNEIVIDDKYVKLIKTKEEKIENEDNVKTPLVITNKSFTSTWVNNIKTIFGDNIILPTNCRLVKKINNELTLFIIEEPPQIRTIISTISIEDKLEDLKTLGKFKIFDINIDKYKIPPYSFTLSFPYIVYFIVINNSFELYDVKLFYRLSPITNEYDYLILNNLSNISDDNSICLGKCNTGSMSYNETVQNILDSWWSNSFNNDYMTGIYRYNNINEFTTFFHWQYYTSIDPMFIFRINWKFYFRTLNNVIIRIKKTYDNFRTDFNFLTDCFSTKKEMVLKDSDKKLIFSTMESINIKCVDSIKSYIISIGDEFELEKDEIWHIESFLRSLESPSHIQFKNENVETRIIKINDICSKLISLIENNCKVLTKCNINGIDIIIGDEIIILNYISLIKKVIKIIFYDGRYEVMLDDFKYYILENIKFKKIDLSEIKLDGVILNINDKYNIVKRKNQLILKIILGLKFIETSRSTNIIKFIFENDYCDLNIDYFDLDDYKIINLDECTTPKTFYVFNKLFYNEDKVFYLNKNNIYHKHNRYYEDLADNQIHYCIDNCFLNTDEIFIPGVDINIHLKVGDIVVISNWINPNSMIIPQKIKKFEKQDKLLIVHTETLDEQVKNTTKLIIGDMIFPGTIRKISFTHGNLSRGNRIKSLVTGICNFPKKDFNTIIGFLTEGVDEPMVLCSNLCTLWFSDIEKKFKIWKSYEELNSILKWDDSPIDITKIKYNINDIIICQDTNRIEILALDEKTTIRCRFSYDDIHRFCILRKDFNFIYYGFLTPRVMDNKQYKLKLQYSLPNMYGKFIKYDGDYHFIEKGAKNV